MRTSATRVFSPLPPLGISDRKSTQLRGLTSASPVAAQLDAQTIILPDGRSLGYAEYGSPTGKPLIFFHGYPSSRLELAIIHPILKRHNIRGLALDRPGFGLSSYQEGRKIMDWPDDVRYFAKQVGLQKFAVLGGSGGGPYALACAAALPKEMMTAVGVLAGATPWTRGIWTEKMQFYRRVAYLCVHDWPSGFRALSAGLVTLGRWALGTKRVQAWIDGMLIKAKEKRPLSIGVNEANNTTELPPTIPEQRQLILQSLLEPFRQGVLPFLQETQLLTLDWRIPFEAIDYPCLKIWHGTKDVNAPIEGMREVAGKVRGSVMREWEVDHYGIGGRLEEVLEDLMGEEIEKAEER